MQALEDSKKEISGQELPARSEILYSNKDIPGQGLAAWTEVLYLSNLMIAPGLAFLLMLWLYFRRSADTPALAVCHMRQTIAGSIWAAVLLFIVSFVVLNLGGYDSPVSWIVVILYFITCHATLILLGVIGLTKALAGQKYVYPLIGRRCD